ncbi:hypothetical protein B1748_32090, partial [Paenibacillus sp. MY03]|uniref:hypothetical protein n=1 Tax=Paenibacillus sp. MY03 TaxID=302980 RepID=UPI000B54F353
KIGGFLNSLKTSFYSSPFRRSVFQSSELKGRFPSNWLCDVVLAKIAGAFPFRNVAKAFFSQRKEGQPA